MYTNLIDFKNDLISTYNEIINIIRIYGDTDIVNKKRQDTYLKSINIINHIHTDDLLKFIDLLNSSLTEKPKKIMNALYLKGEIKLDDKYPYNGYIIKKGELIGDLSYINSFKNISILVGKGIGIGDIGVKELINMGYSSIEQLKKEYNENKLVNLRKGLRNPLLKYFKGNVRLEKMSREEATKWKIILKNIINNQIINNSDVNIKHKISGSYARGKEYIGDIDYVIVVNHKDNKKANDILYNLMINILDKLTEVTDIGNLKVSLDSVVEIPIKSDNIKRYSTCIKLWFNVDDKKTKIEIYGYTNTKFIYPYFARSANVNLQKKVKLQAMRKGLKLSPWGLIIKDTDINIEDQPKYIEFIKDKLEKNSIDSIKDIFTILDYKN